MLPFFQPAILQPMHLVVITKEIKDYSEVYAYLVFFLQKSGIRPKTGKTTVCFEILQRK